MLGQRAAPGVTLGPLPRKVLVVDDEPDLVELAQAMLTHHGMQVSIAYGAAEALRILADDPEFDALFSDVMMPGMTGLDLANATSIRYPHMKIVLTSGYTAPELLVEHGRRYKYVAKPYLIADVIALLRQA